MLLIGCSSQETDWEEARSLNTIVSYERFLEKYPNSVHGDEARVYIADLRRRDAWEEAKAKKEVGAVWAFLEDHPDCRFSEDTKFALGRLFSKEQLYQDAISYYQSAIDSDSLDSLALTAIDVARILQSGDEIRANYKAELSGHLVPIEGPYPICKPLRGEFNAKGKVVSRVGNSDLEAVIDGWTMIYGTSHDTRGIGENSIVSDSPNQVGWGLVVTGGEMIIPTRDYNALKHGYLEYTFNYRVISSPLSYLDKYTRLTMLPDSQHYFVIPVRYFPKDRELYTVGRGSFGPGALTLGAFDEEHGVLATLNEHYGDYYRFECEVRQYRTDNGLRESGILIKRDGHRYNWNPQYQRWKIIKPSSVEGIVILAGKHLPEARNLAVLTEDLVAADVALIRILLEDGADVDMRNKYGATPLFMASQNGHTEIVRLLLAANANVDAPCTSDGATPLLMASYRGHTEIVKLLLAADPNVNAANDNGFTPLWMASQEGHTEIVRLLLAANAGVDIADTDGRTPLCMPSQHGHTEVVKLLLAANANVDAPRTADGAPPLLIASGQGHTQIVKLLLAADASVDVADTDGNTPLLMVSQEGHMEMVKLLLAASANVNAANESGLTPLLLASQNGHAEIVRLLLAANANVDAPRTSDGATPLLMASNKGHTEIVKLLLAANADADMSASGHTPLSIAAKQGHGQIVELLREYGAK
jgi:ankyrin repeat protein